MCAVVFSVKVCEITTRVCWYYCLLLVYCRVCFVVVVVVAIILVPAVGNDEKCDSSCGSELSHATCRNTKFTTCQNYIMGKQFAQVT